MKTTLAAINQMQADGVIGKYAIGGAVGAIFYLEPAATLDVDIFVTLPTSTSGLISLSSIYEYLKARGGTEKDEYIVVGRWPIQFLPPRSDLEIEAINEAICTEVEGEKTWVMTAEHLVAIALRTGRSKDHERIVQFLERRAVDPEKLRAIVDRHGLRDKWRQFETRRQS